MNELIPKLIATKHLIAAWLQDNHSLKYWLENELKDETQEAARTLIEDFDTRFQAELHQLEITPNCLNIRQDFFQAIWAKNLPVLYFL